MGLDYYKYRPKEKLELVEILDLIEEKARDAIKNEYSEYYLDFSVNNTNLFLNAMKTFQLNENLYHFSSDGFCCDTLDYETLFGNTKLYDRVIICTRGNYSENELGYLLSIDVENLNLIFDIGLPYADLKQSKIELSKLLRFLNSEGIYLGLSDYDQIEDQVDQLIDLNSRTKVSNTWQLNIGNYSLKHSNAYAINSKFEKKDDETYRLQGIRIGFPDHYFKHKNISEEKKIGKYCSKLLKTLTKYFDKENTRIQFTSKEKMLIDHYNQVKVKAAEFTLSTIVDLSNLTHKVNADQISQLFETGINEYSLTSIRINSKHKFTCKLSLQKEDDNDFVFLIYSDYKMDEENNQREDIERELNLELEYIGAE